jgi:rod shape-determining protein MreD
MIRSAATLALAFLLLLLQSMVLEMVPVHIASPSFGLLVVLYVGLSPKWTLSSMAIVAFATGYLFDLVSGAPRGTHALVYVIVALIARTLTARLAVRGFVLKAATAFAASLAASLLIAVVRALVSPEGGYAGLRMAPLEALLTGLLAPFVLWLLERLDGRIDAGLRLRVGFARRRPRAAGSGIGAR